MNMRRVVQLCVLTALLAALGLGGFGAQAAPVPGARVTIVQGPDPVSLDPTIDINKTTYNIQLAMFDPLVWVTPDGKARPWVATAWKNVDPTTWRLTIRPGIKFHNGDDLTADDVAFSIETYNKSRGEGATFFKFIKSAQPIDARTVEIVTQQPNAPTLVQLGFLMILPKKYYTATGPERFGVQPVGSGPMQFREWQQGVRIALARNDTYWRGPIALQEATYRPAPEASTRVAMLETAQADIIANVPPELIPRVERGAGLAVKRVASLRKLFLEYNMRQKPFDDIRVRRAFNYAVDKEALINFVLGGNATREYGPIPDGWLGSNPRSALTAYEYDPARARQLLAEAGYGGGVTIDFWHSIGRYLKDKEIAEAIVGQLSQVGVRSNLTGMDIGSLVTRIHTQTLSGVHMFSWAPLIFDTDYLWRAHFYSKGLNQYAWDEKTDQLLTAGASSMDPRERQRLYAQLERYLVNDLVPWTFLYRQNLIYGARTSVEWLPRSDEVIDVRGIRAK